MEELDPDLFRDKAHAPLAFACICTSSSFKGLAESFYLLDALEHLNKKKKS